MKLLTEVASLGRSGEDDTIAFCLQNGAYFIETNMESAAAFGGHPEPHKIWKSSAAAAEYSRQVAREYYGCGRPYGYVFGGSGGGYKTIACIENTNAWDGACPFVIGSPYSLPNSSRSTYRGCGRCAMRWGRSWTPWMPGAAGICMRA